jgi:outer membrane protein assembly factor BamB
MALRGTFQSFHPSELLQFIDHSGKTGTLRIYDEDDTKYLYFQKGEISYAIHQRKVPRLGDLVAHRSLSSKDAPRVLELDKHDRWDDVVGRALARRREFSSRSSEQDAEVRRQVKGGKDGRLGAALLAQGRLTEEQLKEARDPTGIPDGLLREILLGAALIEPADFSEARLTDGRYEPLLQRILAQGQVSRDAIADAVSLASDEDLAELLAHKGFMTLPEARLCLEQLKPSKLKIEGPTVRLGEYLVATGRVSQRQLEQTVEAQLVNNGRLGDILIERGILTPAAVKAAIEEIEVLRGNFSPLYPLRRKFVENQLLDRKDFAVALFEQEKSGRPLAAILVETGKVSAQEMRSAVEEVVVDELCDLLMWTSAAFEFLEDVALEDVIAPKEFPAVQDDSFKVQSLLLRAHSVLDQLRRDELHHLSRWTVFIPTAPRGGHSGLQGAASYDSILDRLNGRASLEDVRRVLPGNRYSHHLFFSQMLRAHVIRPLTREEAARGAATAVVQQRPAEARVLCQHALRVPGEVPSDAELQVAIQDVEWALERRRLQRGVLWCKKAFRTLAKTRGGRWVVQSTQRSQGLSRVSAGLSVACNFCKAQASRTLRAAITGLVKCRLAAEELLIRMGWARPLWTLYTKTIQPVVRCLVQLHQPPRGRVLSAVYVVVLLLAAVLWPANVTEVPVASASSNSEQGLTLHAALDVFEADGPVQVRPVVHAQTIYLASRDGTLRALRPAVGASGPAENHLNLVWELQIGEFGDLLAEPAVAEDKVFIASVRGSVMAASLDGALLWSRTLPRLEPLAPGLLFDDEGILAGITVVSRENAYVLSSKDGSVLYELQTGNRILARPVGDANSLFVGSGDNHIYHASWRQGEFQWEHEERDDFTALVWHDGVLIFATRDGRLAALEGSSGKPLWKRDFPPNSIKGVEILRKGHVYVEVDQGEIAIVAVDTGKTVSVFRPDPRLNASAARPHENTFFYVSDSGYLGEMDSRGQLLWRASEPVRGVSGWAPGETFLAVSNVEGKLTIFPLASEKNEKVPNLD